MTLIPASAELVERKLYQLDLRIFFLLRQIGSPRLSNQENPSVPGRRPVQRRRIMPPVHS
jgi:hypothetical protein